MICLDGLDIKLVDLEARMFRRHRLSSTTRASKLECRGLGITGKAVSSHNLSWLTMAASKTTRLETPWPPNSTLKLRTRCLMNLKTQPACVDTYSLIMRFAVSRMLPAQSVPYAKLGLLSSQITRLIRSWLLCRCRVASFSCT